MSLWVFLFMNGALSAAVLDIDKAKTKVSFLAVGNPSAIKIRGQLKSAENPATGKISFGEKSIEGEVSLRLEALDTGIDLRTRHMKEKYLESDRFPLATLRFSCPTLRREKAPMQGVLTLHGQSKPISGICETQAPGNIALDFNLKVEDFGIQTPSYMGISVTNAVSIQASAEGSVGETAPVR